METSIENRNRNSLSNQTSDSYPKQANAYVLDYLIAESNHGKVYHATVKNTSQSVAFKIIDLDTIKDSGVHSKSDSGTHFLSDVIKEISILKKCRHENVVELKTAFVHKSNICLVMELFEGGTLQDILKQPQFQNGFKDEDLIACILKQILKGLKYCHDNDILHRDLKANNVLINKEGVCKLSDFGFSGELTEGGEKKKVRHTFVGSTHWMAPEVMVQAGMGYNQSADIWSFGITALELANGKTPTEDFSELKIYLQTIEGPSPSLNVDLFKNYSKLFKDMISLCLEKDPKRRPSAEQLLKHSFFNKAKAIGKEYVKEKLMSSVPVKRGQPLTNEDPLGSHNEENSTSLEWDFDRDKFFTENQTKSNTNETDLHAPLEIIEKNEEKKLNDIDLIEFDEVKEIKTQTENQAAQNPERNFTENSIQKSPNADIIRSESFSIDTKIENQDIDLKQSINQQSKQTSPKDFEIIDRNRSNSSSNSSVVLGRFQLTNASKDPVKDSKIATNSQSQALSPSNQKSTGANNSTFTSQSPGEGDKRKFEIIDVNENEIPGHPKKLKQKTSLESLEKKISTISKRVEQLKIQMNDIQEICLKNNEMLLNFNILFSNFNNNSLAEHLIQQRNQNILFSNRSLDIESAKAKEELDEMKNIINSKISSNQRPTTIPAKDTRGTSQNQTLASTNSSQISRYPPNSQSNTLIVNTSSLQNQNTYGTGSVSISPVSAPTTLTSTVSPVIQQSNNVSTNILYSSSNTQNGGIYSAIQNSQILTGSPTISTQNLNPQIQSLSTQSTSKAPIDNSNYTFSNQISSPVSNSNLNGQTLLQSQPTVTKTTPTPIYSNPTHVTSPNTSPILSSTVSPSTSNVYISNTQNQSKQIISTSASSNQISNTLLNSIPNANLHPTTANINSNLTLNSQISINQNIQNNINDSNQAIQTQSNDIKLSGLEISNQTQNATPIVNPTVQHISLQLSGGNRGSSDLRSTKSGSESLEQMVLEQKKNTLNEIRRSNSQQFQNIVSQSNSPIVP